MLALASDPLSGTVIVAAPQLLAPGWLIEVDHHSARATSEITFVRVSRYDGSKVAALKKVPERVKCLLDEVG